MAGVFIAVGSNIAPEKNIPEALSLLDELAPVKGVSTFYRTRPVARPGHPFFYNGVVEVSTGLAPVELRDTVLRPIEERLGRVRGEDSFAPRTIDLDIVVYGEMVLDSEGLVIPDPEIVERAFLAIPLYELAPGMILPGTETPMKEIAEGFAGHDMEELKEFTEGLRKKLAR